MKTTSEGLTHEEVVSRLEKYGYNEIPEKRVSPIIKFLTYFWGPIPWMIMLAALLSGVLQHLGRPLRHSCPLGDECYCRPEDIRQATSLTS